MYHKFRFWMETTYDDNGCTVAKVMECPGPFADPVCVAAFSYGWRACEKINELERSALERGERILY